jgi:hypothetical protein
MSEYKCIRSFTSVRTNRAYTLGAEIRHPEYLGLPITERSNFEALFGNAAVSQPDYAQPPTTQWPSVPDNLYTSEPSKNSDDFDGFGGGSGGGAGASGGWDSGSSNDSSSSDYGSSSDSGSSDSGGFSND